MPLSIRLSIFYGSLCLFSGVQLPFFPVWLKSAGLGSSEISIIIAGNMLLRIAAGPVFAYTADRLDDRRRVVVALAWSSVAAGSLLLLVNGFWALLAVSIVLMSCWPSITPLIETIAMKATREGRIDYGRVRIWCSITFIAASTGTGWLVGWFSAHVIVFCMLGGLLTTLAGTFLLAREVPQPKKRKRKGGQLIATLQIARHPVFMLGLATGGLIQSSHAVYYAFGSINWQRLGYGDGLIGILWGIGVVAEILLFTQSGRVLRVVGAPRLLMLAAGGAAIRWILLAFNPPLWLVIFCQALHGLSFGAAHLGALHFVAQSSPPSLASTAQSLYASISAGIMMGLMTLAAGPLYDHFLSEAYLLPAVAALAAFAGAVLLQYRWQGGAVVSDEEEEDAG
ncbi:PPP family 3-phenylpropionic acid transporter [Parvibaculum indicum]|uniref:MFS transporter n=1 Tax=Parvibaculum indicum TaxID=562969 RepID=UPI00141FB365|nr:MFS transporter [Parvibaculum indicum]NIJ41081.1 PPP family 3-phenylpropionic acid transporter [Parvibaculum indicum]